MARFDELFDEVLEKVRSAADITGKKTTDNGGAGQAQIQGQAGLVGA
jgi:hypothetical protein